MATILSPCSSSSTSATPRPTSGPIATAQLVEHWRFATVRESTADELGAALRNLLELRGIGLADLDASIVSITVPQLRPEWEAMAERYLDHDDARRRARHQDRHGAALRQPARDRRRPARQRGRRLREGRRRVRRRRLRHRDDLRPGRRPRASTSAASSRPGVEISMEALTNRAAALPQDRPRPAALAHRQDDGRRDPLRRRSTASPARSTASCAACAPRWATRPRRSPPAAWPSTSSRSPRRSTRPTTC